MEVQGACARLGFRLVRAFERYVEGGYHALKEQEITAEGIQKWTPKRSALSPISSNVKNVGTRKEHGKAPQGNQFLFPFFDSCIKNFEYDTIEVAATVHKALPLLWKRPNLSVAERSATANVLNLDVGYNLGQ